MTENKLLSIIIPCYNASYYIEKCISSLQKQTYSYWEAIFINDGSTDNSLFLLENYTQYDSRIKVYTQDNKGAAKARELGISKATGDYLTFLDVDDTLNVNALKYISEKAHDNPDIIVSGFNIIIDDKIQKRTKILLEELDNISYLKKVLVGKYGWELCGKVYKKEMFDSSIHTPSNFRIGEDAAVFIQIVSKANKIIGLNYPTYNYIQHIQSISHIKNSKYAEETLEAAFYIDNYLNKTSIYEEIKNEISAMFLLFYSNSSFRYPLKRTHPYIKAIYNRHLNWNSISKLPLLKSIYIILLVLTNGKIANLISRFKA